MGKIKLAISALAKVVFITANVVIAAMVTVWFMDNSPPYVWSEEDSFISPDPAPDGGRVTADWQLDARRLCPGVSQRTLRDAITVLRDPEGKAVPYSGEVVATYDKQPISAVTRYGDQSVPRTFVLPKGLPPIVNVSSELCFRCNPLQYLPGFALCVKTPELQFRVTQGAPREMQQGP